MNSGFEQRDIGQRDMGRRSEGPANLPVVDFSSALASTIESIRDNPAQLRHAIYELARIKLQREAWQRNPPVTLLEMRGMMLTLETAIERVEAYAARQDELHALRALARAAEPVYSPRPASAAAREQIIVIDQPPMRMPGTHFRTLPGPANTAAARVAHSAWGWIVASSSSVLRGAIITSLVLGLYLVLDRQLDLFGRHMPPPAPADVTATAAVAKSVGSRRIVTPMQGLPSQSSGLPLPSVYGVYAVSGGQLYELEALAGRVPDPKVFMSTAIKTPSRVSLPDGRLAFVVYRRDLASNAPERVQVRVIARVLRAMSFNTAGEANTAKVDDQWTIRGSGQDLRVAPVPESAEMLLIKHDDADFVFPAGRYGLVLKGQAYDFAVAGPITDAAQCLERVEAANGGFFSECRHP